MVCHLLPFVKVWQYRFAVDPGIFCWGVGGTTAYKLIQNNLQISRSSRFAGGRGKYHLLTFWSILQLFICDIAPNLLTLHMSQRNNHSKFCMNRNANKQAFQWYLNMTNINPWLNKYNLSKPCCVTILKGLCHFFLLMGILLMFICTVSASFIFKYLNYDFQSICRGKKIHIAHRLHISSLLTCYNF